jgi:hypothetical protein
MNLNVEGQYTAESRIVNRRGGTFESQRPGCETFHRDAGAQRTKTTPDALQGNRKQQRKLTDYFSQTHQPADGV